MEKLKEEIKSIEVNVIRLKLNDKEKKILSDAINVLIGVESYISDPNDIIKIDTDVFDSCEGKDVVAAKLVLESLLKL